MLRKQFISILSIVLIALPINAVAQSAEDFQMEFGQLMRGFIDLANTERSFSVFESEKEKIGKRASDIRSDLRERLEEIEYNQRSSYQELIDEIECFDTFTKYHGINECPCLNTFNVLLKTMNAHVSRVRDKDNIVIEYAVIGNYKFHYVYNKEDVCYRLRINSNDGKGGKSTFGVGSWGGINVFKIAKAGEALKLVNVQYDQLPLLNTMKRNVGCRDFFPRR